MADPLNHGKTLAVFELATQPAAARPRSSGGGKTLAVFELATQPAAARPRSSVSGKTLAVLELATQPAAARPRSSVGGQKLAVLELATQPAARLEPFGDNPTVQCVARSLYESELATQPQARLRPCSDDPPMSAARSPNENVPRESSFRRGTDLLGWTGGEDQHAAMQRRRAGQEAGKGGVGNPRCCGVLKKLFSKQNNKTPAHGGGRPQRQLRPVQTSR